jgi:hypothetical protein
MEDGNNDKTLPLHIPHIPSVPSHQQDYPDGMIPALVLLAILTATMGYLILKHR